MQNPPEHPKSQTAEAGMPAAVVSETAAVVSETLASAAPNRSRRRDASELPDPFHHPYFYTGLVLAFLILVVSSPEWLHHFGLLEEPRDFDFGHSTSKSLLWGQESALSGSVHLFAAS